MLTQFQFRSRFTMSEKIGIEIASVDIPTAPIEQRMAAATLRASMADLSSAEGADVTFTPTIEGVMLLEQAGLIGPGRALAILAATPGAVATTDALHNVALVADQLLTSGRWRVSAGGLYGADDMVPLYADSDPTKTPTVALMARQIALGDDA